MSEPHAIALLAQVKQLVPEMMLALFACILFVGGAFAPNVRRSAWGVTAVAGLLLALFALLFAPEYRVAIDAPFVFDSLALLTRTLAIVGTLLLVGMSWDEVPGRQVTDYYACLLVIALGAGLVGAANDLVGMFMALEVVSIPTYVLLYLPRHDEAAQEAAMKYFLLSVLSSALLLFGFSYLYGLGGTTNISGLLDALGRAQRADLHTLDQFSTARNTAGMALIALIMVVAGLGFRITAVPFHFYAPDVYQGTSAGAAAMLAFIPKVAGFAALLRVLGFVVPEGELTGLGVDGTNTVRVVGMALSRQVPVLLWFLAVITMSLGNLLALLQDNLRRLLAYSSVAHAGYMLVALASAPYLETGHAASGGVAALLYYLVAYGVMTLGVFTVIVMLDRPDRRVETIDDLAGLSQSHPRVALMLTVLLFSLIGIPLTAGFTGKLMIFFGAMSVPGESAWLYRVLAVIGMLNAAIGAWYYLRIVTAMYLRTAVRPVATRGALGGLIALGACVVLTIGLSVPPGANWLLRAARGATEARPAQGQTAAVSKVQ
jgi:NADH-quinone oxidoreductase subunit N